jgi:hypothetical protein
MSDMTYDAWIARCAEALAREGGISAHLARDCAITEFNIRCREEPLDTEPMLPVDRWPDPRDAALNVLHEWDEWGEAED